MPSLTQSWIQIGVARMPARAGAEGPQPKPKL
jgi:hypothetical protein